MSYEIKFLTFQRRHDRAVAVGQLVAHADVPMTPDTVLVHGSLGEIMAYAKTNGISIENTQDILYTLVVTNGFAA